MITVLLIIIAVILFFIAKSLRTQSDRMEINSYTQPAATSQENSTRETVVKTSPDLPIPKTYWEKYQLENPEKASEIKTLGINLSSLSDEDVKERIFALETTARDSKCSILGIRDQLLKIWEPIKDESYLGLVEFCGKAAMEEAQKYNLKLENTWPMLVALPVVQERIAQIELNNFSQIARTKLSPTDLMLMFALESDDDNLTYRKIHLYTKNFPMLEVDQKYLKLIEQIFDTSFEQSMTPILNAIKSQSAQLKEFLIKTNIQKTVDEIKKNCEHLIPECNSHDISFYVELDNAQMRAEKKFLV